MNNNLPIVFVHCGFPSYLLCSLTQAHYSNPNNEIILISDHNPQLPFVRFIDRDNFGNVARIFNKNYVHLNSNPEAFERFCFERWFLVNAFMQQEGVNQLLHADSDLLIYFNANEYMRRFRKYDVAMGSSSSYSGHLMFINDRENLQRICDFFCEAYIDPDRFDRLQKHYEWHRVNQGLGGICDMSILSIISEEKMLNVYDLNQIVDLEIFDQGLGENRISGREPTFVMTEGNKLLSFHNNKPYFTTLDGRDVRALSIHCQGHHRKQLMYGFLSDRPAMFRVKYLWYRSGERIRSVINFIGIYIRHYRRGLAKRLKRLVGTFDTSSRN